MEQIDLKVPFEGRDTIAHITTYGNPNNPHVLCLHGIGSTGSETFGYISGYLSNKYHLVAPDWIGFGKSSRLLDEQDTYSADYCTKWLAAFIETAQQEDVLDKTFFILANSMSAIPVAKNFSGFKDKIRKIIFINPAGLDATINVIFSFALTNRLISQRALAKITLNKYIWYSLLHWSENHYHRMISGLQNGEFEVLIRYARAGIRPYGRMKSTHVIPEKFAAISAPILIISSSRDSIFTKQQYLKFANRYGWSKKIINHSHHFLLTRASIELAKASISFLQ